MIVGPTGSMNRYLYCNDSEYTQTSLARRQMEIGAHLMRLPSGWDTIELGYIWLGERRHQSITRCRGLSPWSRVLLHLRLPCLWVLNLSIKVLKIGFEGIHAGHVGSVGFQIGRVKSCLERGDQSGTFQMLALHCQVTPTGGL